MDLLRGLIWSFQRSKKRSSWLLNRPSNGFKRRSSSDWRFILEVSVDTGYVFVRYDQYVLLNTPIYTLHWVEAHIYLIKCVRQKQMRNMIGKWVHKTEFRTDAPSFRSFLLLQILQCSISRPTYRRLCALLLSHFWMTSCWNPRLDYPVMGKRIRLLELAVVTSWLEDDPSVKLGSPSSHEESSFSCMQGISQQLNHFDLKLISSIFKVFG